jgi:hypothetical protein
MRRNPVRGITCRGVCQPLSVARLEPAPSSFRAPPGGILTPGQTAKPSTRRRGPSLELLQYREQLLRLEEAVRACRTTLKPLVGGRVDGPRGARAHTVLNHRIEELRRVFREEAGVGPGGATLSEQTLDAVLRLRRCLMDLAVTLEGNRVAARRWSKHGIGGDLNEVPATVEWETPAVDRA